MSFAAFVSGSPSTVVACALRGVRSRRGGGRHDLLRRVHAVAERAHGRVPGVRFAAARRLERARAGRCGLCRRFPFSFNEAHASYEYGAALADAIVRMKNGQRYMARRLGPLLVPALMDAVVRGGFGAADVVVPVPLHARRLARARLQPGARARARRDERRQDARPPQGRGGAAVARRASSGACCGAARAPRRRSVTPPRGAHGRGRGRVRRADDGRGARALPPRAARRRRGHDRRDAQRVRGRAHGRGRPQRLRLRSRARRAGRGQAGSRQQKRPRSSRATARRGTSITSTRPSRRASCSRGRR